MNAQLVQSIVAGLTATTKAIILSGPSKELFVKALFAVADDVKARCESDEADFTLVTPSLKLILNPFRFCPIETARVVLIGQDPYPRQGDAMGLSFSVPYGVPIPASLGAIYKCLQNCGLIPSPPGHGDLMSWVRQGVLLMNAALTTIVGSSHAHTAQWAKYTAAIVQQLSDQERPLIFILLGRDAQILCSGVDLSKHTLLKWGHPSPVASHNTWRGPDKITVSAQNFINADVFTKTNYLLIARGEKPIAWDSILLDPLLDCPMKMADDEIWVFTDGAATKNGRAGCRASWGYVCFMRGDDGKPTLVHKDAAEVETVEEVGPVVNGKPTMRDVPPTNNRGELTAIMMAAAHLEKMLEERTARTKIVIVSDSDYSIKCIEVHAAKWLSTPGSEDGKKNLDLIYPAKNRIDKMRSSRDCKITFRHVRSHKDEPEDRNSVRWFVWYGNSLADLECTAIIDPSTNTQKGNYEARQSEIDAILGLF